MAVFGFLREKKDLLKVAAVGFLREKKVAVVGEERSIKSGSCWFS